MRVHLRDRGDHALQQGLLGHFKAEEGNRQAATDRDVFREVQSECRLSLRRARGENDELGGLQPGEQLVEFAVTGGDASDAFAFANDFF